MILEGLEVDLERSFIKKKKKNEEEIFIFFLIKKRRRSCLKFIKIFYIKKIEVV